MNIVICYSIDISDYRLLINIILYLGIYIIEFKLNYMQITSDQVISYNFINLSIQKLIYKWNVCF